MMPELFITVVIPTYNNSQQLAECLLSLAEMEYGSDHFEVVVVDDGSDVSPQNVVNSFQKNLNITLVTQKNSGPAAARNAGAEVARGKFLAFTDDDCRVSPDWLDNLASRFRDEPDCAIGGRTINSLVNNVFSVASQSIIDFVYAYYNGNGKHARFFASNNLALPTEPFKEIGRFDPNLRTSEDRDLCERWLSRGYRMIFAPEAVVYHSHALTLSSYWRQHFHYGRGAFHFRNKVAQRVRKPVRLESTSFYSSMFLHPFSQYRGSMALRICAMVAISQFASALGFTREWLRAR